MKMFLGILFLIIAVVILGGVLWVLSFHPAKTLPSPSSQQGSLGSVCIKPFGAGHSAELSRSPQGVENCFQVELAKAEAERERGLMNRKELDRNKGMLFIFEKEGIYPFWMENTLIPLDIIWIDSNSKVVFIAQDVQPCKSLICPSVIPSAEAKYVLEINAGICREIGLKVGDEAKVNVK